MKKGKQIQEPMGQQRTSYHRLPELSRFREGFINAFKMTFVQLVYTQIHHSKSPLLCKAENTCFLSFDEAVAYKAAFVIESGSDGRAETLLEPAQ